MNMEKNKIMEDKIDYYMYKYYLECDRTEQLEKALDKACEHLENFSRFTEHGTILRNKEQWKEYLMNEKD